jgi:hypothetical protein
VELAIRYPQDLADLDSVKIRNVVLFCQRSRGHSKLAGYGIQRVTGLDGVGLSNSNR